MSACTKVINIRCATADKARLTNIQIMIDGREMLNKAKFIPQGQMSRSKCAKYLHKQNIFIILMFLIPIVGLTEVAASTMVPSREGQILLGNYIVEKTSAHRLEPINQTEDLGIWFLVPNTVHIEVTKQF